MFHSFDILNSDNENTVGCVKLFFFVLVGLMFYFIHDEMLV